MLGGLLSVLNRILSCLSGVLGVLRWLSGLLVPLRAGIVLYGLRRVPVRVG